MNPLNTLSDQAPPCAPPDFSPRRPRFVFPALACDSHAHILGPASQFAYSPERVYTPPDCLLRDYRHMLSTLGVARAVLVQPSVYGTDNTVMLRALDEAVAMGHAQLRGVAVVEPTISTAELQSMHALGVRGVRVNIVDVKADLKSGRLPMDQLRPLAERVAPLGWHMEFLLHVDEFPSLDQELAAFPVPMVFGHLGYARAETAQCTPGFAGLLNLMRDGRAWVKLTGPYRIAQARLPGSGAQCSLIYDNVAPLAATLIKTAPKQIVWGSDWPHVMHKGPMVNDGDLADLIPEWISDPLDQQRVLVDNPARLYDF